MLPLVLLRASQRQKNTESAVFLSKRDKRKGKFVLYLRSFDTDEPSVAPGLRWSIGAALAQIGEVGLFALGTRFGRHVQRSARKAFGLPMIGLAGQFFSLGPAHVSPGANHWKDVIAGLCEDAHAIVFVVSGSPGLAWELNHILARAHLGKTIFLIPPWSLFRRNYGVAAETIILRARDIFQAAGISMPRPTPRGKVFLVRNSEVSFERILGPVWPLDRAVFEAFRRCA